MFQLFTVQVGARRTRNNVHYRQKEDIFSREDIISTKSEHSNLKSSSAYRELCVDLFTPSSVRRGRTPSKRLQDKLRKAPLLPETPATLAIGQEALRVSPYISFNIQGPCQGIQWVKL